MTKALLEAYFQARQWYEKAQPTDATQSSMYNQGREAVLAFLRAFEAAVGLESNHPDPICVPVMPVPYPAPTTPSVPDPWNPYPGTIPGGPWSPYPWSPQITW